MPALGESVTEGTVTRWLKQEGDTVELDEPLLEVSTDKVDTEIPSPAAGVLKKIVAQEDDTVEVGGELAVIGDAGEDGGGSEAPKSEEPAEDSESAEEEDESPEPEPEPEEKPEPEEESEPEQKPAASSGGGDATPVLMPELGESVTEGTVTRWLKKVGDSVEVDEPLVEVSTDKVDTEIPSPVAGTLVSITAEEDDTVAVGGELAKIGDAASADSRSGRSTGGLGNYFGTGLSRQSDLCHAAGLRRCAGGQYVSHDVLVQVVQAGESDFHRRLDIGDRRRGDRAGLPTARRTRTGTHCGRGRRGRN